MTYYVLDATVRSMRAHDSRRVALVQYTGTLPPCRLRIDTRYNGLTIVEDHTCYTTGQCSQYIRRRRELEAKAKAMNAGIIH